MPRLSALIRAGGAAAGLLLCAPPMLANDDGVGRGGTARVALDELGRRINDQVVQRQGTTASTSAH